MKITKIRKSGGCYSEVRYTYALSTTFLKGTIEYYGNRGYACPQFEMNTCNGYFWDLNDFMKDFYSGNSKVRKAMDKLDLNESVVVKL